MTTAYDDITFSQDDAPRKQGELHPRGSCKAVCVDVIDLGLQENTFKKSEDGGPLMERRIRIVWETSRVRSDGRRFTISKSYKLSTYDGANGGNPAALYTHLSSWLGPDWNGQFSSKQIFGRSAELFIEHEKGRKDKTKTFAKILAVHPLDEGEFPPSGTYKRYVAKGQNEAPHVGHEDDDNEVPF